MIIEKLEYLIKKRKELIKLIKKLMVDNKSKNIAETMWIYTTTLSNIKNDKQQLSIKSIEKYINKLK